jgi:hypothetical protein
MTGEGPLATPLGVRLAAPVGTPLTVVPAALLGAEPEAGATVEHPARTAAATTAAPHVSHLIIEPPHLVYF